MENKNNIYWVARNRGGSLNIFNLSPTLCGEKWLISPSKNKISYIIEIISLKYANAFNKVEFDAPKRYTRNYILVATGIDMNGVDDGFHLNK